MNNINDQLDAAITVLLIFELAQQVSGNLLPIFRSVRLWFTAMWCVVLMLQYVGGPGCRGIDYVFGVTDIVRVEQHPSHQTHSLRRLTPDLQPTATLGQYTTLL